jgi:hypothetical protein
MCKSTMPNATSSQDHMFFAILPENKASCQLSNVFRVVCYYNTIFNKEAVDTLDNTIPNWFIPYTDFKPFILKYILKHSRHSWVQ